MQKQLTKNLQQEKRRMVLINIIKALVLAGIILAASFAVMNLGIIGPGSDNKDTGNQGPQSDLYVTELGNELSLSLTNGDIVGFFVHGNGTATIHPKLFSAAIVPIGELVDWFVNATLFDASTDPISLERVNYTVPFAKINAVNNEFVNSLGNTTETSNPGPNGHFMGNLQYQVFFRDYTALEFDWLTSNAGEIVTISHFTWSGSLDTGIVSNAFDEQHYVTPVSAFDSFLNKLTELFAELIG